MFEINASNLNKISDSLIDNCIDHLITKHAPSIQQTINNCAKIGEYRTAVYIYKTCGLFSTKSNNFKYISGIGFYNQNNVALALSNKLKQAGYKTELYESRYDSLHTTEDYIKLTIYWN